MRLINVRYWVGKYSSGVDVLMFKTFRILDATIGRVDRFLIEEERDFCNNCGFWSIENNECGRCGAVGGRYDAN